MRTIAIIPARSGSRGLPGKNIRPLGGYPLIAWSIMAAKKARVDRVIVSTDSQVYAAIAKNYGAEAPFLRPARLAEDVPTELVAEHAISWLEENEKESIDAFAILQCTTPLVRPSDIDSCFSALRNTYSSSVTVCEVAERPEWMFQMVAEGISFQGDTRYRLKPFISDILSGDWGIRQCLQPLWRPNGACYALWRNKFMEERKIFFNDTVGVEMPRILSLDVDTAEDFELLEAVVANKGFKPC